MKKNYIIVRAGKKSRYLCTQDLDRVYYFTKKTTPKLPRYDDDAPLSPITTKPIKKSAKVAP